jgi:D-alanyl-D-alanine carboxypeptidase/D-alanyl-D-alanine-endopeptidase (penicillin-binding protein 4)
MRTLVTFIVRVVVATLAAGAVLGPAVAADEALPPEVRQALKRNRIKDHGLSVYVHEIGQGEPVLAFNADVPRNPASTMKLLPTLVALEELGPAYTWKTEAYAGGPVRDGVLHGDLYLRGYGDPYLVVEHFWRFLRALRQAGIDEIRGDLVVDQSFFAPGDDHAADFDGRAHRAYNVQPRALLVNFQTVQLRFLPQPRTRQVAILADPLPAQFAIDNRVRLTRGLCRGGARRLGMQVTESGELRKIVFRGNYPVACGEDEFYRVVADTEPYLHGVFKSMWVELGGRFEGGVREGPVPEGALLLHSAVSPPFSEIIRVVNKYSNNVMARQVMLTLGAEKYGAPGTVEKGEAAIRAWLLARGLDFPELVIENGSGLSREARVSARHLGELLLRAWDSPYMPEFLASLPIMSVDGTLRGRGGTLAGRAHLKTGSLNNVRAKAGIVLDARGRRLAVVILHNDARADTAYGEAVQQAVLEWVDARP